MKGLEKLTSMRLAEVLTQKDVVPVETITDSLYIQDKYGDTFVNIMVDSGHVAEWDLARVVVESFQLPFLLAGNYQISEEAKKKIPEDVLFKRLLVPLDVFDDVITVSMPVMTTSDVLMGIETKYHVKIFPYVGLISENKKVLQDEFAAFKEWHQKHQDEKDRRAANIKKEAASAPSVVKDDGGGWADLFDTADEEVKASINKGKPD